MKNSFLLLHKILQIESTKFRNLGIMEQWYRVDKGVNWFLLIDNKDDRGKIPKISVIEYIDCERNNYKRQFPRS